MKSTLPAILKKDLSYNPDAKEAFHREGQRVFRALARHLELPNGSFEIRSNKGGIAVSGEVTLHHDTFYIQVSQFTPSYDVLYRTCKGQNDYCGGRNHFCSAKTLVDLEKMATHINWIREITT